MRSYWLLRAALISAAAAYAGGVWLDVPFVRQERNGCGSASLAMLIQYWQRQGVGVRSEGADASRIQNALYSSEARGITGGAMQRYLEENGFRALVFHGQWPDLEDHVGKGRPLIVCLGGRPLHYVVVAGVDGPAVLVNDPADRKLRRLDRAGFDRRWRAAGNWTLLAVPRQDR